jgi:hypothetical protein
MTGRKIDRDYIVDQEGDSRFPRNSAKYQKNSPSRFGEGQTALGGETSAEADISFIAASVPIARAMEFNHLRSIGGAATFRRSSLWCAPGTNIGMGQRPLLPRTGA